MYKCKVLELLDKNSLNFDVFDNSSIWDFSENQILLEIEKTLSIGELDTGRANEKSKNVRMFL